eukprot:Skav235800  [mRNA]  locus=scaffold1267:177393:191873:- [translate_table: standard]
MLDLRLHLAAFHGEVVRYLGGAPAANATLLVECRPDLPLKPFTAFLHFHSFPTASALLLAQWSPQSPVFRRTSHYPMEVGAACAAAGAAGLHLAGYNRANYFENLHLKQSRNFRKQQIVHSQADLFRADVEQAIGASSAVQDRLIVVSALLLGVTAHTCLGKAPLQGLKLTAEANTRSFLQDVFYLCIGNAFLYFLVSLIASISCSAEHMELLNNCVRPPFAEMMRDQGVSQVLRIPGADQLAGQKNMVSRRSTMCEKSLREGSEGRPLDPQEMQHDWDELQTYTPYFLVWGSSALAVALRSLRSLLNSFGFFALSHTYRASWRREREVLEETANGRFDAPSFGEAIESISMAATLRAAARIPRQDHVTIWQTQQVDGAAVRLRTMKARDSELGNDDLGRITEETLVSFVV